MPNILGNFHRQALFQGRLLSRVEISVYLPNFYQCAYLKQRRRHSNWRVFEFENLFLSWTEVFLYDYFLITIRIFFESWLQCFWFVFIRFGPGSGSSILGWIPIRIPIQSGSRVLMIKIWKKFTAKKKTFQKLQFTYPEVSRKDVQATEEAFSHPKRTSSTSKHAISKSFLLLWDIFALLDPDPESESGSG